LGKTFQEKSMKASTRLSKVGAAVSLLAAMAAPGAARADAIAQSVLDISNFTFRIGNGNGTLGTAITPGGPITINRFTMTVDRSADLAGTGNASVGGAGNTCFGACGTFNANPYAQVVGAPTTTYVGGASDLSINLLLTDGATARTVATVSLKPGGDGTAGSNVNLNGDFDVNVGTAGTRLEVAFDAQSILRTLLDDIGTASASNTWNMTLRNAINNALVFSFNGQGGAIGGTVYSNPFLLTDTISTTLAGDVNLGVQSGNFHAETAGLAAGSYRLSLRHTSLSDAFQQVSVETVPEPATLSLVGVAVLGVAAGLRRRRG
jgi:hypothetical protein